METNIKRFIGDNITLNNNLNATDYIKIHNTFHSILNDWITRRKLWYTGSRVTDEERFSLGITFRQFLIILDHSFVLQLK